MITSRFYYKNVLKRTADNLGDGTKYATATGAAVNQDDKQFTLGGLSIVADLGADAADKFNGMILCFPTSGNVYHIVDWDAASDIATVFETPANGDTTACEIRENLTEGDSDVDYPIHRLADGRPSTSWKGSGANQVQTIRAFLPNLIEDGGFESHTAGNLSSPWSAQTTQWQVSATSPLLGSRMAVYTQSAVDCYLKQNLVGELIKGKTYRIMFKAQAIAANPPGDTIQIKVRQQLSPNKDVDSDLDYKPIITTTATWLGTTFVADFSTDMAELFINALGSSGSWGSCTAIRIDELYIYEDIAVDRLIAYGHSWNNGEITSVYGCRCHPGRTSFSYANDASANLAANQDIDQTETYLKSLTSSNYPVWEIKLTAASGITYEAAVLFLGAAFAFVKQMSAPFDDCPEEVGGILNESQSGPDIFHKDFYRAGTQSLRFVNISASFYAELTDWWQEVGRNRFPYFFCFDEDSHPENIRLMRCLSNKMFPYNPVRRDGTIDQREVI